MNGAPIMHEHGRLKRIKRKKKKRQACSVDGDSQGSVRAEQCDGAVIRIGPSSLGRIPRRDGKGPLDRQLG